MRATLSSLWLLPHLLGTVSCRLRGETAQVVPMLLHRTAVRAESKGIQADRINFQRLLLYMMMRWRHQELEPRVKLQGLIVPHKKRQPGPSRVPI